ncbi:hypothetical protein [Cupriavidus laharis]|uniref:hypothetical protein n=1 Tax=Cupriavidus laharis TaxID=151654 RepID=UPI001CC37C4D|nr:hypothetical protein [Cupriavidus laharis]
MCDAMRARKGRLPDGWKIDVGSVDTVEGIGEDGERDGRRDLSQLSVGVAGRADGSELVLVDRATGGLQVRCEAHQGITLGITRGLPGANGALGIDRQTYHLAYKAVCGQTNVATRLLAGDSAHAATLSSGG